MATIFKRQILTGNALLHYLLPERRNCDIIRSLRNSQPFPSISYRTNGFRKYACLTVRKKTLRSQSQSAN